LISTTKIQIVVLAAIQLSLLTWLSISTAPVIDEVPHLVAGLRYVESGRIDLYCVNPPLTRLLPAAVNHAIGLELDTNWQHLSHLPRCHREIPVATDFVCVNGSRVLPAVKWGRLSLLPFSLVGLIVVASWSSREFGKNAAIASTMMFCSCPEVLAWSSTICPDAHASSIGVAAAFFMQRWLKRPEPALITIAGILLGLSILCKFTMFVFLPAFAFACLAQKGHCLRRRVFASLFVVVVALFAINTGYGFDGTLQSADQFEFESLEFRRIGSTAFINQIPIPLPSSLVQGLDEQLRDFELGQWCYMSGEFQFRGWWYWYIYMLLVKTPEGILIVFACSLLVGAVRFKMSPRAYVRENLMLLAPPLLVFILVSSQTGFTKYSRYIIPCYPFVFIWMGQIFDTRIPCVRWLRLIAAVGVFWAAFSSFLNFPYCLAYFNASCGGAANGHSHLLYSAVDWGQDVQRLRDFQEAGLCGEPLFVNVYSFLQPVTFGIRSQSIPVDEDGVAVPREAGWYAISTAFL